MEKIITFEPAFDKRNKDPNKNYGIHGVTLRMTLKGKDSAVGFVLYTNWQLPHVQKEQDARPETDPRFKHLSCHPMPADLGYHSLVPQYEGQDILKEACEYLDGKPCYYDGSGLNAEPIYKALLEKGEDGVWRELEIYHREVFGKEIE